MAYDSGVAWFVEKRMIDRLPQAGSVVEVQMGDHGRFTLEIRPNPDCAGAPPEIRWFPPADPYMEAYCSNEDETE